MIKQRVTIGAVLFWCVMAVSGTAWCGDNGNGTITVNGLVWLKDTGCLGYTTWYFAKLRPKSLASGQCGLTDNSKAGDWRLPNIDELKAIYSSKSQFMGVQANSYWSSSTKTASFVWSVNMGDGNVGNSYEESVYYVWPVRGGP